MDWTRWKRARRSAPRPSASATGSRRSNFTTRITTRSIKPSAGLPMRDAVIVEGDLDMIVDADAALLPFRVLIGLRRQRLQLRTIDLFQHASARHAEPADRPHVVEAGQ